MNLKNYKNSDLLFSMRRRKYQSDSKEDLFLVFFTIEEELPLICKEDLPDYKVRFAMKETEPRKRRQQSLFFRGIYMISHSLLYFQLLL